MKKIFSFSIFIFIILLSGACKSKAPPRTNEQIQTVSPSTPTVKQPAPATTTPTTSQPSGITDTNIGNRHQSGIILDGAVVYTVKAGDTLSGIARQFYQDGSYYPLIMMVSSGILDIDKIYPNMKFTIPNLKVNMNDPTAKANINRYFLQIAAVEEQRGRSETAALIRNHTR